MTDKESIQIEGGIPLVGEVKLSGSKTLALKLIYASLLSGENCILDNVPRIKYIEEDLAFLQRLGVSFSWLGQHKLLLNSSGMSNLETAEDIGENFITALLAVPALIHKFGKTLVIKPTSPRIKQQRLADIITVLGLLGLDVEDRTVVYSIIAKTMTGSEILLPDSSRFLTELAIMACIFIPGESVILNSSHDNEIDDLIAFCCAMGAQAIRLDTGDISITGVNVLKSVEYELPFDRDEAVFFATCGLLTKGNVNLFPVERYRLLPFLNWISKIGGNYELSATDLRVWESGSGLKNISGLKIAPFPDITTDWQPFTVLIGSIAEGDTQIIEHPNAGNLNYIPELNRMGAKISFQETTVDLSINIIGGRRLKGERLLVSDPRVAPVLWCAALVASGKSELLGYNLVGDYFEDLSNKLLSLGAMIS
jgi:UDP-N-acetylglucosamine 1-carboxyvinyltransferase